MLRVKPAGLSACEPVAVSSGRLQVLASSHFPFWLLAVCPVPQTAKYGNILSLVTPSYGVKWWHSRWCSLVSIPLSVNRRHIHSRATIGCNSGPVTTHTESSIEPAFKFIKLVHPFLSSDMFLCPFVYLSSQVHSQQSNHSATTIFKYLQGALQSMLRSAWPHRCDTIL